MLYDPAIVEMLAKEIAKESNIKEDKLNYIEKDIWLTYLLKYVYKTENAANELVFKGGTSLVKCHYNHYRFSEDLDFSWIGKKESKKLNRKNFKEKYINKMVADLGLGLEETAEIKDGVRHSRSGKILNYFFILPTTEEWVQKPKVKINVSFDEIIEFPVQQKDIKSIALSSPRIKDLIGYFGKTAQDYFDSFVVPTYSKEEIACEKVRAFLTRKEKINRSRDIIDLFYLSKDIDLSTIISCARCQRKITNSLQTPAYREIFKERKANLDKYINNIIEYAKQEPVYVKEIDYTEIYKFGIEKLKPIIEKIGGGVFRGLHQDRNLLKENETRSLALRGGERDGFQL